MFEKFFGNTARFTYNDFPILLRDKIHAIDEKTDVSELAIRMILDVEYDDKDDLGVLSDFILDLNPAICSTKILFECSIDKEGLLKELPNGCDAEEKKSLIIKTIHSHLKTNIFAYNDTGHKGPEEYFIEHRTKLVKKDLKQVKALINLNIINVS